MKKPVYESATIVIPTYNRMELLDRTLASLAKCVTPRGRFQVLVCDDGSSDNTAEIVDRYRKSVDLAYEYQEDRGFRAAQARNMALRLAKYPLLVFLDCGLAVSTNFIDAHIHAHQSTDLPSAFIGYVYGFDRNNENATDLHAIVDHRDIDASIRRLAAGGYVDVREEIYRRVDDRLAQLNAPWALLWSCNFSIELDIMRIVGGFNANFTTWGGEDLEFGYKLHRCGVSIALCREAAAIHLPHDKDGRTLEKQWAANLERETRYFHDPAIEMVLKHGDFGANTL